MNNKAAQITFLTNSFSRWRALFSLIVMSAICMLYFSPSRVDAAAGDLDTSFGFAGKVVTDVAGFTQEFGHDVAIQPDGKILVAGYALNSANGMNDFAVLRYNPDGSLDTSFGIAGKVFTDFGNSNDEAHAIALQADGRILLAGRASSSALPNFAVARYLINGDLDQSFGVAGRLMVPFTRGNKVKSGVLTHSWVWEMAVQADGKIVLAGDADAKFGIARLNPDGSLDPGFGANGKIILSVSDGTGGSAAYSVALQTINSEQRIVAAGYANSRLGGIDFGLARFRANGEIDNTFEADGKVLTDFACGEDSVRHIVIDSINRIVVGGTWGGGNFAIARYNPNGTLDSTFDSDGKVVTDFSGVYDEGRTVAIQPDGKIIVGGTARVFSNPDFALARYNTDGSPDISFGNNSKITTDFTGQSAVARSLVLQPDNKVVLVGYSQGFALARYLLG
jgi:uncharacterized delta-60 repeat protein